MIELFTTGRFFDVVLGIIALEIIALLGYRLVRKEHLVAPDVYPNLLAAAGLLGAARAVMISAWWGYVGLLFTVALVGHVVALRMRWQRAQPRAQVRPRGSIMALRALKP
jgi:hypothetical protein